MKPTLWLCLWIWRQSTGETLCVRRRTLWFNSCNNVAHDVGKSLQICVMNTRSTSETKTGWFKGAVVDVPCSFSVCSNTQFNFDTNKSKTSERSSFPYACWTFWTNVSESPLAASSPSCRRDTSVYVIWLYDCYAEYMSMIDTTYLEGVENASYKLCRSKPGVFFWYLYQTRHIVYYQILLNVTV